MSKMKKFMSLLLAAVMVLSVMTVNVFAEEKGTITVENATLGEDYAVYKMFSMKKVGESGYAYMVENAWRGFFTGEYEKLIDSKGQAVKEEFDKITNLSAFAGVAADWAEANSVPTVGTEDDADETTLKFSGLDMGYYLVTSTFSGGLCMLTNAEPSATIVDKNFLPAIEKGVNEDDDGSDDFVLNNDAYIGQDVDFQIVVTSDAAPEDYVVTDTLEVGKWDTSKTEESVVVKHVPKVGSVDTLTVNDDYKVTVTGNVIKVEFKDASLTNVKAYDELVITYTAKLAGTADVSDKDNKKANTNTAKLSFTNKVTHNSDVREIEKDTNTYTWKIPVFKYTGTNEPLKGAEFVLQDAVTYKYYSVDTDGVVSWVDKIDDAKKMVSGDDGMLYFNGVDTGNYVLIETKAPDGYNMAADKPFTTTLTITEADGVVYDDASLKVQNNTGAELPETGGIGTTIFRVGGTALIVIAGALLIAKKRANNI